MGDFELGKFQGSRLLYLEPPCGDHSLGHLANVLLLDSNGDARIDLSDAVSIFAYLFLGGAPPVRGTGCLNMAGCPFACFGE